MSKLFTKFWAWYERHYTLNVTIAAFLFVLQLIHLYWLTTHVVSVRLFNLDLFNPPPFWELTIILVDYTEIPALITTSLVYINEIRKYGFLKKNIIFLIFINIQLLHIFWITDEVVIKQFTKTEISFPAWLAWIAIMIDYLELPVIYDALRKVLFLVTRR